MPRPSFDEIFLDIARTLSTRSTCPKLHVGAVVVDTRNRIVGCGYNGAPSGLAHCDSAGCNEEDGHCTLAVHADINSILNAPNPALLQGATMYLHGGRPCYRCAQAIVVVGIKRVVYFDTGYIITTKGDSLLADAGVTISRWSRPAPMNEPWRLP